MELAQAPGIIHLTAPDDVQRLSGLLSPDLIQQAFSLTDTVTLRKRKLLLESMVWLVIGMAMFNNRPLSQIVNLMNIVDRTGRTFTAPGSVIARRKSLGEDAVRVLFDLTAGKKAVGRPAGKADRAAHQAKGQRCGAPCCDRP